MSTSRSCPLHCIALAADRIIPDEMTAGINLRLFQIFDNLPTSSTSPPLPGEVDALRVGAGGKRDERDQREQ